VGYKLPEDRPSSRDIAQTLWSVLDVSAVADTPNTTECEQELLVSFK
jgi:hypothetical protein